MRVRLSTALLALVLCLGLSACQLNVNPSAPTPQLMTITVTPSGIGKPVGISQQFTATGTFNNKVVKNVTSMVTWASSSNAIITIDSSGLATAKSAGTATISATMNSVTGSTAMTVNSAQLTSVTISPAGPAMAVGSTQPLAASANYTDGTSVDVTSSASWTSSNVAAATVSGSGMATAVAAGQSAVVATFNAVSGTTAVNVIPQPAAAPSLNGNYAFSFTSQNASGPTYFVGSFHANGSGTVDSGVADIATATGATTNVGVTGSYGIGIDGRGTLTLTPAGLPSTVFRFVLTSSGTTGLAIEWDGAASAAGSFQAQDSTAFSTAALAGNYVFRVNGVDHAANPMGEVGLFTTDGAGNITGGSLDASDFGVISPTVNLAATTYQLTDATHGRGTITLTSATGSPSSFAFYVVSAAKIILVETDMNPVLAGAAEQQTGQPFSDASLQGGYGFKINRAPASNRSTFDLLGRISLNAAGGVNGGALDEVGQAQNTVNSTGSTYTIAANGRGVLTASTANDPLPRTFVVYVVSSNRMLMLETYTQWAGTGGADIQSATISNATLTGNYGMAGASIGQDTTEVVGWFNSNAAGLISGIEDKIVKGTQTSVVLSASYAVTNNGRTLATPTATSGSLGVSDYIFYVLSPAETLLLGAQPALDGSILAQ